MNDIIKMMQKLPLSPPVLYATVGTLSLSFVFGIGYIALRPKESSLPVFRLAEASATPPSTSGATPSPTASALPSESPDPDSELPVEETPTPEPEAAPSAAGTPSATASARATAAPTRRATPRPTASQRSTSTPASTPVSTATATPTPSPTNTTVVSVKTMPVLTIQKSASVCGSGPLWFVPAGEAAKYKNGLAYTTQSFGTSTSLSVPAATEPSIVFVINEAGQACLLGYQIPGTDDFTIGLDSTTDATAYPDLSGVSTYELQERLRRLRLMSSYTSLRSYLSSALQSATITSLSNNSSFLSAALATVNQYDDLYPDDF